jgi:hypothetical protein
MAPTTRTSIGIDMKKIVFFFVWTLVFVLLLLGIDQFFLRVPASMAPHREAQVFYLDFRTRLLALFPAGRKADQQRAGGQEQPLVPAEKGPGGAAPVTKPPPPSTAGEVRYIYVDQAGELHFADSLQEVPSRYRAEARPMSR